MKCARRRFSASGNCISRIVLNFSSDIPGLFITRAACTEAGALTTRMASQRSLAPGLEQKRDIEDNQWRTGREGAQKCLLVLPHERMHDGFELPHPVGPVEHRGAEFLAIDRSIRHRPRKRRADQRRRAPAIERVDSRIRVVNRNAEASENIRRCGFAHADRTGQAEDKAHAVLSMSPRISASSSGVTDGVTPNHRAKPGTA